MLRRPHGTNSLPCSEALGLKIARGTVVSRDAKVEKHTFRADIGGNVKPVTEYLRDEDVAKTKALIVKAIQKG